LKAFEGAATFNRKMTMRVPGVPQHRIIYSLFGTKWRILACIRRDC
jgi:hypothetical protein